jgi:hypothetical protein
MTTPTRRHRPKPHPARRSRRLVGTGSVVAMLTLTGCIAATGASSSQTASKASTATSSATANTADSETDSTTATTTAAIPGVVSSQANTVSSGS